MKKIIDIRSDVPAHWVGDGFPVRSLFSYQEGSEFDPFLLLDYAGPYEFAPAEATRGVGEHPHRGFETVTIVYQGELEHRDSSGSHGSIGPGDVQWMTAAAGVVHEEFHSERFSRDGGTLEMVQLWVNLPAKDKMSPPRYQSILSAEIPEVALSDDAGSVRVIAGDYHTTRGPAKPFTPIRVCDVRLGANRRTTLPAPENHTAVLVVRHGDVTINNSQRVSGVALIHFERAGAEIAVEAHENSAALLLSGEPIGEPVVGQGPFVMNSPAQIRQAILDYQTGKMGSLS
jgi:redox-sensitive bicupin YhaK (pirin superfamily)